MGGEVIGSLIAGVAAIVGAVITAFSHEIKSLLLGKYGVNKDLKGRWKCQWTEHGEKDEIVDSVKIVKVSGDKVSATATNAEYGDYAISGRISRSGMITMHYEGEGPKTPLGGVILLNLNATRSKAMGIWHEFSESGEIVGGLTMWTKENQ